MNKENVQKWIAALRSGKYKQGHRYLRQGNCFCALGVGCDVYSKEWHRAGKTIYTHAESKFISIMDTDVMEHYGIPHSIREHIWELNDLYNQDFNQIADYLEEQLNNDHA